MRDTIRAWNAPLIIGALAMMLFFAWIARHAPRDDRPLAWIRLGPAQAAVVVPGRSLQCLEPAAPGILADCMTTIAGRPLQIRVEQMTTPNADGTALRCTAAYGDSPTACSAGYAYAPSPVPAVMIHGMPGLSDAQLESVRRSYPVAQLTERDWGRITLLITIAIALPGLFLAWRRARPTALQARLVLFASGGGMAAITFWTLLYGLLRLGFID